MPGFLDGGRGERLRRVLFYRLCRTPRHWHNRDFTRSQTMERTPSGGFRLCWPGHGEIETRSAAELPRCGEQCAIVASGPSVKQLPQPERLFDGPAACVNGSVALAQQVGAHIPYYFVSDSCFVEQKPDLFASGVALADAVVLNPKTVFAALQHTPGLLQGARVYLHDDLKSPFKRARSSRTQMRRNPNLLLHPQHPMAFSLDLTAGTYPSGTVVYQVIQTLFGIGYQRLLMFGVDLNGQRRFYREATPSPSGLDQCYATSILPAFELVQQYCQQTGLELFNCSRDSRLPATVIPKLDGETALTMSHRKAA